MFIVKFVRVAYLLYYCLCFLVILLVNVDGSGLSLFFIVIYLYINLWVVVLLQFIC